MITLLKSESKSVNADSAVVLNWNVDVEQATGRAANHNLSHEARSSNVVVIGGHHVEPDFRPDLGARLAIAA